MCAYEGTQGTIMTVLSDLFVLAELLLKCKSSLNTDFSHMKCWSNETQIHPAHRNGHIQKAPIIQSSEWSQALSLGSSSKMGMAAVHGHELH